jgi:hypothetical protein
MASELNSLVGPRVGEEYVYRLSAGGRTTGSMRVAGVASDGPGGVRVEQTPAIDGLATPEGMSATDRYTLMAADGSLRMLTRRDGAQTLLREPLAPGGDGWPRVLRTWVPGEDWRQWVGRCAIVLRSTQDVLGTPRTVVATECAVTSPLGTVVVREDYALGLGLVRRSTDLLDATGDSLGADEQVLEAVVRRSAP